MANAYRGLVAVAVLVTVVLAGSDAHATDQGITGKKLLLKSRQDRPALEGREHQHRGLRISARSGWAALAMP